MKKTNTLPVSTKFLARIEQRIAQVLTAIGSYSTDSHSLAMSYVHSYLSSRQLPTPVTDTEKMCHLICLTLTAEIDCAILRSLRARERRRKSDTPLAPPPAAPAPQPANPVTSEETIETPSTPSKPANKPKHNVTPLHAAPPRDTYRRKAPARGRFGLKIRYVKAPHRRRR